MTENEASRTLVKSPPELWAECSDASSLARHLGQFGEIRITRLEPETAVAWEGEDVSGTVRLEPSGWGTRVILTVQSSEVPAAKLVPVPDVQPVPESPPEPEPAPPPEPLPPAAGPPQGEASTVELSALDTPRQTAPGAPPEPPVKVGLLARWFGFLRRPRVEVSPVLEPEPRRAAHHHPGSKPEAAPAPVVVAQSQPQPITLVPQSPQPQPQPQPQRQPPPEPRPRPEPDPAETSIAALTAALDSLGQAHHRPYSRS